MCAVIFLLLFYFPLLRCFFSHISTQSGRSFPASHAHYRTTALRVFALVPQRHSRVKNETKSGSHSLSPTQQALHAFRQIEGGQSHQLHSKERTGYLDCSKFPLLHSHARNPTNTVKSLYVCVRESEIVWVCAGYTSCTKKDESTHTFTGGSSYIT